MRSRFCFQLVSPPRRLALGALVVVLTVIACGAMPAVPTAWAREGAAALGAADWPWWVLPIAFFGFTSVLGVVAVLAGLGGGVLYVPLVAGIAPFVHLDFIRGAGLLVAMAGALTATPTLVRRDMVNLRLAIPLSVTASVGSIAGALIGLALPVQAVQLALGVVILGIAVLLATARASPPAEPAPARGLTRLLQIDDTTPDAEGGTRVAWRPRAFGLSLGLFSGVGVMAGMFGLGAGWANVPVLNLVMGVPLRFAVSISNFLLATTGVSAVLIYLHHGAVLPLIAVPSVLGIMLGARAGTWLLMRVNPTAIRRVVIVVLLLAGVRALLRGFGI